MPGHVRCFWRLWIPPLSPTSLPERPTKQRPEILFRLYTTYQPGGTGERNLVLTNLQHPSAVHDAVSGVNALRAWGRWYQRCIDFGMNLPDPMVLVGALTAMTKPVISKDVEVTWRTEMVKSALQLHARPSEELELRVVEKETSVPQRLQVRSCVQEFPFHE